MLTIDLHAAMGTESCLMLDEGAIWLPFPLERPDPLDCLDIP